MEYNAKELLAFLNELDETSWIEAKTASQIGKSIMETISAFSNEPDQGGGYLVLGAEKVETSLFPEYNVVGVVDPDKIQMDLVSQCSTLFNIPIRPEISVERVDGKNIIVVFIPELSPSLKPVFINSQGLPRGAFRRSGTSDVRCTTDDLQMFYRDTSTSYDKSSIKGTSMKSVDPKAIERYRQLRANVNPASPELEEDDHELLNALACTDVENPDVLNLAGLLVFGTSTAIRQHFPMLRVDYIRVPGNEWVPDPDNRFVTIDMRGPLMLMPNRIVDAINADLPKGFLLLDALQADSVGMPLKALREAIVNSLIHRSYREHSPIQIIRYNNRIEIRNPGFSLKNEEKLGQSGSETRNPFIASIFHETNLAETKGSGIRAMRKYMAEAKLAPPTFDSDRENNSFTVRLLLHHFLDQKDLAWLQNFKDYNLNDNQKQSLIFVREVGAIDNQAYRQIANCDTYKASVELRQMRDLHLLDNKGKGKGTYYTKGHVLDISTEASGLSTEASGLSTEGTLQNYRAKFIDVVDAETFGLKDMDSLSTEASSLNRNELLSNLPFALQGQILGLKTRERDSEKIFRMVLFICKQRPYKLAELACIFNRGDNHVSRNYVNPLLKTGHLDYVFPDMPNHPQQAYTTKKETI